MVKSVIRLLLLLPEHQLHIFCKILLSFGHCYLDLDKLFVDKFVYAFHFFEHFIGHIIQ